MFFCLAVVISMYSSIASTDDRDHLQHLDLDAPG